MFPVWCLGTGTTLSSGVWELPCLARCSLCRLFPLLSGLAALCAECLGLRAGLLTDCESLVPCCSRLTPDITFRFPSARASQPFPDLKRTPHLPPPSSHIAVILPGQTDFLHVCISESNTEHVLNYQEREGQKKEGRNTEQTLKSVWI